MFLVMETNSSILKVPFSKDGKHPGRNSKVFPVQRQPGGGGGGGGKNARLLGGGGGGSRDGSPMLS